VIAARRAGDLDTRLAQPIVAARERFRRRFSHPADGAVFDDELRVILAGGAATTLR